MKQQKCAITTFLQWYMDKMWRRNVAAQNNIYISLLYNKNRENWHICV